MSRELTFDDLAAEAAQASQEVHDDGKSTGEWLAETVELLDKRGLLEPMLFGADRLPEPEPVEPVETTEGISLTSETIAKAGKTVMTQLGSDVTVSELVDICEKNPTLVDQKLSELGGVDL